MPRLILSTVSPTARDLGASISRDELELYFASDRSGSFRIWRASRTSVDLDFDPPSLALFDGMETAGEPTLARHGVEMFVGPRVAYRNSISDLAWTALADEAVFSNFVGQDFGDHDVRMVMHSDDGRLYESKRAAINGPWSEPRLIPGIQVFPTQNYAAMSDDGLELFIQADLEPAQPNKLLYTWRPSVDAPFATPTVLFEDPSVRFSDPAISGDGSTLYFSSNFEDPSSAEELYVVRRERM